MGTITGTTTGPRPVTALLNQQAEGLRFRGIGAGRVCVFWWVERLWVELQAQIWSVSDAAPLNPKPCRHQDLLKEEEI